MSPRLTRAAAALLAAAIAFPLVSCAVKPIARAEYVLGTTCSITLYEGGRDETVDAVFARLRGIEDRMSANQEGTEVDRVNASAGLRPEAVSADTLYVLKTALEYGRISGGALDVSIGPLVKLWGIGTEGARIPSREEIEAAKALVDYRLVEIDEAASTAYLPKKGMRLDLGAVAKGYAADEAARMLDEAGIERAIIDLGGNIYALGRKKDGTNWRIGVQGPDDARGSYLGIASVADKSLVTSGDYERFFEKDGKRYHHILDAKTGYPSASGLRSVTVVGKPSIACDALSTSLFALGREKGLRLAKELDGFEFVFVDAENKVWMTDGLEGSFTLRDDRYSRGSE